LSIRLMVTILEVLATIAVIVAVTPGLPRGRWYPEGAL
jgi:hypothetical protein